MSVSYFTFSGSPYEQGLLHGEALKSSIENNISVYLNRFNNEAGIQEGPLMDNSSIYFSKLQDLSPEYSDVINGIAKGSKIEPLNIAMLNLRYELLYDAVGKSYRENAIDGCTSFAILPDENINHLLIIGQNWDWIPDVKCALVKCIDEDGLQRLAFTEAGIVGGKPGMNSSGIGMVVNGMYSELDNWMKLERPFHLRCYDVLKSHNLTSSLNALLGTPRSCTANFIVGHSPNNALNIELAPDSMRLIDPVKGILSHANHLIDPDLLKVTEPVNPNRYLSEFRCNRMESLLLENKPIDVEILQNILKDHKNHPQSLCRHRDNRIPTSQHTITKTSIIMDLTKKVMWITDGQPCKSNFQKFSFN